jgi:hypothetical protein
LKAIPLHVSSKMLLEIGLIIQRIGKDGTYFLKILTWLKASIYESEKSHNTAAYFDDNL